MDILGPGVGITASNSSSAAFLFEFKNLSDEEQGPVLFITDDLTKNDCRFEIRTLEPVTFDTSSEIRLTFSELIGNTDIESKLTLGPDEIGWNFKFESGRIRYWSLRPSHSVPLQAGSRLAFHINNIKLPPNTAEGQYSLKVEWQVNGEGNQQDLLVLRTKPGPGAAHMEALIFGCQPVHQDWNVEQNGVPLHIPSKQMDEVFASPVSHVVLKSPIGFFLANASSELAVPKLDGSVLQVSFRVGGGAQALVAQDAEGQRSLSAVDLIFVESSANARWSVTRRTDAGIAFWEIAPLGSNFFEKDEVVSFVFRGVEANHVPGISAIEISYFKFPEYRNNTIRLLIHKVPSYASILEAFWAYDGIVSDYVLSWKSFGSSGLSAEIYDENGKINSIPLDPQGKRTIPKPAHAKITLRVADSSGVNHVEYLVKMGQDSLGGNTRTGNIDRATEDKLGTDLSFVFSNISEKGRRSPILFISEDVNDNRCQLRLNASKNDKIVTFKEGGSISIAFPGTPSIALAIRPNHPEWVWSEGELRLVSTSFKFYPTGGSTYGMADIIVPKDIAQTMHWMEVRWRLSPTGAYVSQRIPVFVSTFHSGLRALSPAAINLRPVAGINTYIDNSRFEIPWKARDEVFANHYPDGDVTNHLGFTISNNSLSTIPKVDTSRFEIALTGGNAAGGLALRYLGGYAPNMVLLFEASSSGTTWDITRIGEKEDFHYVLTPNGPNLLEKDEVVSFVFKALYPPSILGEAAIQIACADVPEYQDGVTTLWARKTFGRPALISYFYDEKVQHTPVDVHWNVFGPSVRIHQHPYKGESTSSSTLPRIESGYSLSIGNPHKSPTLFTLSYADDVMEVVLFLGHSG